MKTKIELNFRLMIVFLITISIQSCSSEEETSLQIADVSSAKVYPVYEMFDSLEIISLDVQPDALIGSSPHLKDCQDYFVIEKYPNFFIFDKKGAFISSTQKILGHGKGEVASMVGCSYNPYSRQIEILTFGKLMKYDIHMNFISQHRLPCDMGESKNLNKNSGAWFQYLYDFAANKHLLIAGKGLTNSHIVFFYDSQKNSIIGQTSLENDIVCSYGSWQRDCFFQDNSVTYIIPPYILNRIYSFDDKKQEITPYVQLDFGSNTLNKSHIKPYTSKDYIENQNKVFNYLWFDCDKHFPILSAVTNNRLFTLIHTDIQAYNWYISEVDLKTFDVKRLEVSNGNDLVFPMNFSASDGYVYGIDNDEERIKKYISSFKYQNKIKYTGIADTLNCSNAVIFKYKVK